MNLAPPCLFGVNFFLDNKIIWCNNSAHINIINIISTFQKLPTKQKGGLLESRRQSKEMTGYGCQLHLANGSETPWVVEQREFQRLQIPRRLPRVPQLSAAALHWLSLFTCSIQALRSFARKECSSKRH